jgi:hypothetical protein
MTRALRVGLIVNCLVFAAAALGLVTVLALLSACQRQPASSPGDADADAVVQVVSAGAQAADGVCALLEGVDDSGTLRTLCAFPDEVAQVISFITMLRASADVGAPPATCSNLPGTVFCASKTETAKGIGWVVRVRAARLMLDAGAK